MSSLDWGTLWVWDVSETTVEGSASSAEMDEPPKRPLETNTGGEAEGMGPSSPVGRKLSFIVAVSVIATRRGIDAIATFPRTRLWLNRHI